MKFILKPTGYAVTHPVTGHLMVFVDRDRAIERASTMRTYVVPLFTPLSVIKLLQEITFESMDATIDMLKEL